MNTRGTSIRQVAMMNVVGDEIDKMSDLNTVWAMTMDREHNNVLAYPEDIMVDKIEEIYPPKYVDLNDFNRYVSEDGAPWLIAKSLHISDLDLFFQYYLHLDEADAA
ncbi:MAG: hypothetical protein AB7S65_03765 [Sulfuricurvum sp.]